MKSMLLRVVRKDGAVETISIDASTTVHIGEDVDGKPENHLTTSSGVYHLFSEDGTYNGWAMVERAIVRGSADGQPPVTMQGVSRAEAIERHRSVENHEQEKG